MSRYAGRHRAPSESALATSLVRAHHSEAPTLQLGAPEPAALQQERPGAPAPSRLARGVGVAAAVAVLAVGGVDLATSGGHRVIGPVSASDLPAPSNPSSGTEVQSVGGAAEMGSLSVYRNDVREARDAAAGAAASAAAQAAADAAAKAAADAAAKAAADAAVVEAQRQAAAAQAARDAQRQSLIDNARKDPRGAARAMLDDFGFADSQFSCLNSLWTRESNWLYSATNPSSGAYGIPQSLPASKMASAGADYRTNPVTQIRWGLGYIKQVYGTPCGAWGHSQATGWY
jgi:hypothetical protein